MVLSKSSFTSYWVLLGKKSWCGDSSKRFPDLQGCALGFLGFPLASAHAARCEPCVTISDLLLRFLLSHKLSKL